MARRKSSKLLSRSLGQAFKTLTQTSLRTTQRVIKETLNVSPARKTTRSKKAAAVSANWTTGIALGAAGPRRYRLYKPSNIQRGEQLPLLVMLHGCGQDAQALASSSRMNQIAARERFFVLYPEQDRLSNLQGCWNWFDTRTGRAQAEESSIIAAIESVCLSEPIQRSKVALAGISAGASMAALLATQHSQLFCAIAMHSGIAPGVARSSAGAVKAMFGQSTHPAPLPVIEQSAALPALLVIHGAADGIVALKNGEDAALRWGERVDAKASQPRIVQRGSRYAATITDYKKSGRLVATLCVVERLGHAWSGGAAGQPFSDQQGPDASRMIWSFVAKQFARVGV